MDRQTEEPADGIAGIWKDRQMEGPVDRKRKGRRAERPADEYAGALLTANPSLKLKFYNNFITDTNITENKFNSFFSNAGPVLANTFSKHIVIS